MTIFTVHAVTHSCPDPRDSVPETGTIYDPSAIGNPFDLEGVQYGVGKLVGLPTRLGQTYGT